MKTAKGLLGLGLILGTLGVFVQPAAAVSLTAPTRVYTLMNEDLTFEGGDTISQQSRIISVTGDNDGCTTTPTNAEGDCTFVQIGLVGAGNGTLDMDLTGIGVESGAFGTADTINFGGNTADVNTALQTLTYTPNPGFETFDADNDRETLEISVSGAGDPETDATSIDIRVLGPNALPEVTVPPNTTAIAGGPDLFFTSTPNLLGFVAVTDEDAERDEVDQDLVLAILWVDECGQLSGFDPNTGQEYGSPEDLTEALANAGEVASLLGTFELPDETAFATNIQNQSSAHAVLGDLAGVNAVVERLFFHPPADGDCTATINVLFTDLGNNGAPMLPGEIPVPLPAFDSWDVVVRDGDNDPPVVTRVTPPDPENDPVAVVEGVPVDLSFTVDDPDAAPGCQMSANIAVSNGELSITSPVTGDLSALQGALGAFTYTPDQLVQPPDALGSVQVTVNDEGCGPDNLGGDQTSDPSDGLVTFLITDDGGGDDDPNPGVNDPPTISVTPGAITIEEDEIATLGDFQVGDPDLDDVTVTLSVPTGTLSDTSEGPAAPSSLSTSLDNNITFTPAGVGQAVVTVTVTDPDGATGSDTVTIDVTEDTNAAPTISVDPPTFSTELGDPAPDPTLGTWDVEDIDADADDLSVELVVTGTGDGTLSDDGPIAGTIVDIENALDAITFTPTVAGEATVTATVTDAASGDTAFDTVVITITDDIPPPDDNDPPTISVTPDAITIEEDEIATLGDFQVGDPDLDDVTVTLSVPTGTLSDTSEGPAAPGSLSTSLDNNITFTPAGVGQAVVTVTVTDPDGATGSDTVTIDVTEDTDPPDVNEAPTIDGPDAVPLAVVEGGQLAFTGANAITIADDADPAAVLLLQVSEIGTGTVSAAAVPGDTLGTLAQLQAVLDDLVFTAGTSGDASVTITVDDQGATGSGGAKSATLTIPITVTAAQVTTTTTSTTLGGGGGGTTTSTTAGPNVGAGGASQGGAGGSTLPRTGADLLVLAGFALVLAGAGGLLTGRRGRLAAR